MAYTSEKDLNVFLENKFEILDEKLENWYGKLMAQDAVIIAIAVSSHFRPSCVH